MGVIMKKYTLLALVILNSAIVVDNTFAQGQQSPQLCMCVTNPPCINGHDCCGNPCTSDEDASRKAHPGAYASL